TACAQTLRLTRIQFLRTRNAHTWCAHKHTPTFVNRRLVYRPLNSLSFFFSPSETSRLFHCKQRSIEQACGDSDTDQPVPGSFERSLGELVTLYCQPYEHGSPDCAALDELPKLAPNETVPQSLVLLMKSYVSTFG
ncbi:unnamed protein product, partial [Ixodes persulcatus]